MPATIRQLVLSRNRFAGSVPASVTLLTALTKLEADDNALSGSLPPELLSMTWLR
jgi:hypothetical protein